MDKSDRGLFGTKMGVILATAGSAVGLGNIWRFPYVTGQNGGATFILIYIVCVLLLGVPAMLCEMIIGRHAHANTARAYTVLSNGKPWKWIGYLGVLTSVLILGYYGVVCGWTLRYMFSSLMSHPHNRPEVFQQQFQSFISNPIEPILWLMLFMTITYLIIIKGVKNGIEKASKYMMPQLFVILLVLVCCSLMLPNAWDGVEYLFKPDFSKVTGKTVLEALGQAFFSLSIAMGCLCTYASYFTKDTKLTTSALQIAGLDTLVAILSGLIIFPAALSVGIQPDSGPSLIFITLPNVFDQAFGAIPVVEHFVSFSFFLLLSIAALTSLISIHEVSTSFLKEELHLERKTAARLVSCYGLIAGALCSLSMGDHSWFSLLGMNLFDLFDRFTANYCLPIGAFLTCLFIGWYVDRKIIRDEMTNGGSLRVTYLRTFVLMVRYVCPFFILIVFLHQLGII